MSTRTPLEARTPRMEALARLPVFFALTGRRAVVAAGEAAATWKAELLAAAGATVDVFAAEVSAEMAQRVADTARIRLHRRPVEANDLRDAVLAVGAFEDDAEAAAFAA